MTADCNSSLPRRAACRPFCLWSAACAGHGISDLTGDDKCAMLIVMKALLDERIVVMVSSEQKQRIHALAAEAGMGIGEWIRGKLLSESVRLRSVEPKAVSPREPYGELLEQMQLLEQRLSDLEARMGKE